MEEKVTAFLPWKMTSLRSDKTKKYFSVHCGQSQDLFLVLEIGHSKHKDIFKFTDRYSNTEILKKCAHAYNPIKDFAHL